MKKLFLSVFILVLSIAANAQMVDPVHFTSQLNMLSGDEAEIVFSAKIDKGWHLYSTDLGNDGLYRPHSTSTGWTVPKQLAN